MKIDWNINYAGNAEPIATYKADKLYERVYYYQDENSFRSFFIICDESKFQDFIKLKSLEIKYEESESRYQITSVDHDFNDTFERLFLEMFDLMISEDIIFLNAYNHIIEKYKSFLMKDILLSKEKQIGLLGELNLLRDILKIDSKKIECWIDSNEDFRINNTYIEVKSSRSKEHKHIINGLAQLTVIPNTTKFLFSSLVTDYDKYKCKSSFNLFEVTEKILDIIDLSDKNNFLDKLRKRGYYHIESGEAYKDFNYDFYETKVIEIYKGFPCLNLNTFEESIYSNVNPESIKYELRLSNLLSKSISYDIRFIDNLFN
jgi:hypothetical protein